MFFVNLWKRGFKPTIFLLATIIVFTIIVNLTQPLERVLKLLIPNDYIFWGLPFLIIVGVVVPVMGFLTNGKVGNLSSKTLGKMPLLNIIFKKDDKMDLVKQGIPAAIQLQVANLEIYIYGFVMGASKVITEDEEKTVASIYLPSVPIPLTSWIVLDVNIENVKEVEVIGKRMGAATSIIQNKCISFGQPLARKIKLKNLEKKEVEENLKEKSAET